MAKDSLPDGLVIIYGLADPFTSELRYVGKTWYSLRKRRKQHLGHSKNVNLRAWVSELRAQGGLPEIFEIERCTRSEWVGVEQFWISYFRFIGCGLLNIHEGGGGSVSHKPSALRKIAEGRARWKEDPSNIQMLSAAAKAQWQDDGYKTRTLAAQRAAITPELRKRRSEDKKKDWQDPAHRATYMAARAGVDQSKIAQEFWKRPEYRARQAAASAAAQIKKSASLKASWARRKAAALAAVGN